MSKSSNDGFLSCIFCRWKIGGFPDISYIIVGPQEIRMISPPRIVGVRVGVILLSLKVLYVTNFLRLDDMYEG